MKVRLISALIMALSLSVCCFGAKKMSVVIKPWLYASFDKDCALKRGSFELRNTTEKCSLVKGVLGNAVRVKKDSKLIYDITNFLNKKSLTISYWFKTSVDSKAKVQMIFLSISSNKYANKDGLILLKYNYGPRVTAAVMHNWKRHEFSVYADMIWAANSWHQIVYSISIKENYCDLYLDGELVGSRLYSAWKSRPTKLVIGNCMANNKINPNNAFCGIIDELCIYNQALSAKQIKQQYNNTSNNQKEK